MQDYNSLAWLYSTRARNEIDDVKSAEYARLAEKYSELAQAEEMDEYEALLTIAIEKKRRLRRIPKPKKVYYYYSSNNDPIENAMREARKEHAFLLRCEGESLRSIGKRLDVSGQNVRSMCNQFGRRFYRRLAKTRWTICVS